MQINQITTMLGGVGLGAALMYVLDPAQGRRRRALVRDKLVSAGNKTADAVGATARDMKNRAQALDPSRMLSRSDGDTPDTKLVARVRSKLGRVTSHPHAIHVEANQGRVTLSGQILQQEVDNVLTAVSKVSGVQDVENNLEPHEQADVPALQGGRLRQGDRFEFMQENWSPTARVLAGTTGGALAAYGFKTRSPVSILLGTMGAGLMMRGITNLNMSHLAQACVGRWTGEAQTDKPPQEAAY